MRATVLGILLVFYLVSATAWSDGLWGRELKKLKPAVNDEGRKLAEEIIHQYYKAKQSKMSKMDSNPNFENKD